MGKRWISFELPEDLKHKKAIPETEADPVSEENNGWIPKGYDWSKVHKSQKRLDPWDPEDEEKFLIPDSFMTDFCLAYRGYEAPLMFWMWGAIFAVSSILKRQAWMKFGHKKEYPNIYMMFVAPPGVAKKTTSIDAAVDILRNCMDHVKDPKLRVLRIPNIINDATEEALHSELKPEQYPVKVTTINSQTNKTEQKMVNVHTGSNAVILANEVTTLISKKKYQMGMATKLTSLYDCRDQDDRLTKAYGREPLEHIYITFAGATTPGALEASFPEEALSGGLLSRTCTIFQESTPRRYPLPVVYDGVPGGKELAKRLAWIVEHAVGEYTLSPVAEEYYNTILYDKITFFRTHGPEQQRLLYTRIDTMVRKISVVLRAMEYKPGTVVDMEHLQMAWAFVEETIKSSNKMLASVTESEDSKMKRWVFQKIESKDGGISYRKLLTSVSRKLNAGTLKLILDELKGADAIEITDVEGEPKKAFSFASKEIYHAKGDSAYSSKTNADDFDESVESYNRSIGA